jgi:hypothetical protein
MEKTFDWLSQDEKVKKLSKSTSLVLEALSANWPANPLEVARALQDTGEEKSLSAKYLYHFKKLDKMKMIRMKKVGNTYIAWPTEVERLRVLKDVLKHM